MLPSEDNGWGEWRKYVLKALEENSTEHREIMTELRSIGKEVAALKVKAGMWGLVAGSIPVLVALGLKYL